MTKKYFAVSTCRDIWQRDIKDLYIIEPYVRHFLERNRLLQDFNSIEMAPLRLLSSREIIINSKFVDAKYEKYISILTKRLNSIHGTCHAETFWRKTLSMAFIRYITIFHDLFERCERFFDSQAYTCNILSQKSFFIPIDFEDHRYFFQNTDYGQEQIFSIYMRLFHAGEGEEVFQTPNQFEKHITRAGLKGKEAAGDKGIRGVKRILSDIARQVYRLANQTTRIRCRDISIGLVGTYFSAENQKTLLHLSGNRIYPVDWAIAYDYENADISWDKRTALSEPDADFDRFDWFFFSSLASCLPRAFVEHYTQIEKIYSSLLEEYPSMHHIVSEGWISDTYMSLLLALAQEKGIRHITNEHNGFIHPFEGSYMHHVIGMSDTFISLGWGESKYKNLVRGSSLFPFAITAQVGKKFDILFIAGPVVVKLPHYNAAWGGYGGLNSTRCLAFIRAFFKSLADPVKKRITYRRYPSWTDIPLMNYDKEYYLASCLTGIGSFSEISEPAKIQMLQSKLVVVDYISCSYLESISMNIPTVFFWNPETFCLSDNYRDFFKPLLDAGICQKDPVEAARFIESIHDDPEKWWFTEEVQKAKDEFLNKNIGKPEVMIEYLLGLLKK